MSANTFFNGQFRSLFLLFFHQACNPLIHPLGPLLDQEVKAVQIDAVQGPVFISEGKQLLRDARWN